MQIMILHQSRPWRSQKTKSMHRVIKETTLKVSGKDDLEQVGILIVMRDGRVNT
jgi:hypothetical protein